MSKIKHICGLCGKGFGSEKGYLNHKCPKTKNKPTDLKHQEKSEKIFEKMRGG